jgi:tetratricopeptide (TPR) repeat protein
LTQEISTVRKQNCSATIVLGIAGLMLVFLFVAPAMAERGNALASRPQRLDGVQMRLAELDSAINAHPCDTHALLERSRYFISMTWRETESIRDLLTAVALDSNLIAAILNRIDREMNAADRPATRILIDSALILFPGDPAVIQRLVRFHLLRDEAAQASELLDGYPSILEKPTGLLLLGDSHLLGGDYRSASLAYRKAEDIKVKAESLTGQNSHLLTRYIWTRVAAALTLEGSTESAAQLLMYSRIYQGGRDINFLARALSRITGNHPVIYEAFFRSNEFSISDSDIVDAHWTLGHRDSAQRELARMIERDPSNSALRLRRASLGLYPLDYQAPMREDLDHCIATYPESSGARVLRGTFFKGLGSHDSAISDFRAALEVDSSAWMGILQQVNYEPRDVGLRYLKLLETHGPRNSLFLSAMAGTYSAFHLDDSALLAWNDAMLMDPSASGIPYTMQRYFEDRGDTMNAARMQFRTWDWRSVDSRLLSPNDQIQFLIREGEGAGSGWEVDKALGCYTRALEIDSSSYDARALRLSLAVEARRIDETAEDEAWILNHGIDSRSALAIARLRMDRGDIAGTLEALASAPDNFDTSLRLLLLYRSGTEENLFELWNIHLARNPTDEEGWSNLASQLITLGQYESAIAAAARGTKVLADSNLPRNYYLRFSLCMANLLAGHHGEAFTIASADSSAPLRLEAMLSNEEFFRENARARAFLIFTDSAIDILGETDLFTARGTFQVSLHDPVSAIASFTRALALDSTSEGALFGRAEAFAILDDYDHAIIDYERYLGRTNEYDLTRMLFRIGMLHLLAGRDSVAENCFDRYDAAVDLSDNSEHHAALYTALMRKRMGNDSKAFQLLDRIIAADSESWAASVSIFFKGGPLETWVLSSVNEAADTAVKTQAFTIIGLELMRQGDTIAGMRLLEWVEEYGVLQTSGYLLARDQMRSLRIAPPPSIVPLPFDWEPPDYFSSMSSGVY